MRSKLTLQFVSLLVLLAVVLTACGQAATPAPSNVDWSTVKSAADAGGMDALVAAAKAEGELNVIALPDDWCNYG